MAKFTIERQFLVPHYRHTTYDAPDLAAALKLAEEDQDWDHQIADYDNSRPEETTGAWEGERAYEGENVAPKAMAGVVVEVSGGMAEILESPPGVPVTIRDYDIGDYDGDDLSEDADTGHRYIETTIMV